MSAASSRRAVLEVDLDALAANYRRLQAAAAPARVAAVVKADGYGLGAARVAPALWRAGARDFFVAGMSEGLALRPILPEANIVVLDGLGLDGADACAEAGLVPVLNQPDELSLWAETARTLGRTLPSILQVDTGMTRAGWSPRQLDGLGAWPAEVGLELVLTHLACADEPRNQLNELQRQRLLAMAARFPGVPTSIANSSGIFLGEPFHLDLCRPGAALYGVNPTPGRPNPMLPVVRLAAPVLQVQEVDAAGTVGYGAAYSVGPGMRIACVPVGYADGLLRSASPWLRARVAGREVPLAGRISMDLLSIDVSALEPGEVTRGVTVELIWGPDGLDRAAQAAGTLGYELLTRLGARFERVYLEEGA